MDSDLLVRNAATIIEDVMHLKPYRGNGIGYHLYSGGGPVAILGIIGDEPEATRPERDALIQHAYAVFTANGWTVSINEFGTLRLTFPHP